MELRPLRESDAEDYLRLRKAALKEHPLSFGASPESDRFQDVESFAAQVRAPAQAVILGAWWDGELVGVVGIFREHHRKARHKAQVWGMYVSPSQRGRGIAASLLRALADQGRAWPGVEKIGLSVTEAAPEARDLYLSFGFEPWGKEPDALRHGGVSVAEEHLCLDLRRLDR